MNSDTPSDDTLVKVFLYLTYHPLFEGIFIKTCVSKKVFIVTVTKLLLYSCMSFRKYGIPGETLHAKQHMPEPSAELRAAFPINPSSFYVDTRSTSHQTAGAIHDVLSQEVQTD